MWQIAQVALRGEILVVRNVLLTILTFIIATPVTTTALHIAEILFPAIQAISLAASTRIARRRPRVVPLCQSLPHQVQSMWAVHPT